MVELDPNVVQPDSHLTLHYRLSLADGTDVISTFAGKPATLLLGHGQLAPALEAILLGMKSGSHSTFQLVSEPAFGRRDPALVQKISLNALREQGFVAQDFSPGDVIEFNASGTQEHGSRYAGMLKAFGPSFALFDFNHPLADQALIFEVRIIGIL